MVSANQLNGRATGALFFTGFGALWLLLGLYVRGRLSAGTAVGVALIASGLGLSAFHLMREARRWPEKATDPARGKAFARINTIQGMAAFGAAFVLGRMQLSAYIPAAVAAIVGLHLLPLARLFRYRPHAGTGLALVLWSLGTCLFVPIERLQGVAALGAGVILWVSAAITLALAFAKLRKAPVPTVAA